MRIIVSVALIVGALLLVCPVDSQCPDGRCQVPMRWPLFGGLPRAVEEKYVWHKPDGSVQRISRLEAVELLNADSRKLRVTVIGDEVRLTVAKDLADVPGIVVQDVPRGHWWLRPGFVQTGNPTVYVQQPDGKVLHRQDNYAGGKAALTEAIRKAREGYDSKRDPDLRKAESSPDTIVLPRPGPMPPAPSPVAVTPGIDPPIDWIGRGLSYVGSLVLGAGAGLVVRRKGGV